MPITVPNLVASSLAIENANKLPVDKPNNPISALYVTVDLKLLLVEVTKYHGKGKEFAEIKNLPRHCWE